jgi:hypothetical protein
MIKIKTFSQMNEKVGIPDGILELSNKLYTEILKRVKDSKVDNIQFRETEGSNKRGTKFNVNDWELQLPTIDISGKINDFDVKSVSLVIQAIQANHRKTKRDVRGASYRPTGVEDYANFVIRYEDNGHLSMGLELEIEWLARQRGDRNPDLQQTILNNKKLDAIKQIALTLEEKHDWIESSMSHELMHSYDMSYIKGSETLDDRAKYAANSTRFGIKAIDSFMFNLYFMCAVERAVKVVEVGSGAIKVQKKDFLDYLNKNDVYKKLKDIRNWDYKTFKRNIVRQTTDIKKGMPDLKGEDYIQHILQKTLGAFFGRNMATIEGILQPRIKELGFREMLLNQDTTTEKDVMVKFIERFRDGLADELADKNGNINPDKYFKNKEKEFHYLADKLIKKIDKLYDLAKDDDVNPMMKKITDRKPGEYLRKFKEFN